MSSYTVNLVRKLSLITLLSCFASTVFASTPTYTDFFGKAIKGYDPVAYFSQSQAIKGSSDYVYEWNDVTWHFSSMENKEQFSSNPEKYAPQYGGYCAWAVSKGYTAKIDPEAWRIVDEKLYLNYNTSVQKKWEKDIPGNIAKADQNWPNLINN